VENLRYQIEQDLHESVEGEWKIPVELTGPDGITQTHSANNTDELLGGQMLNFTSPEDPITGEATIVNNPILVIRISSLDRVPANGEKWYIKVLYSEIFDNKLDESFVITKTRAKEDGSDIGFVRLYMRQVESTGSPVS
jgi:hypothetical protein